MRKLLCAAVACALLFLSACGGAPAADQPSPETSASQTAGTFTDDLGRQVTVDRPERVVCLIGSFADVWYLSLIHISEPTRP